MRIKIRSVIVVSVLILSALIVGLNFGIVATDAGYELSSRAPPGGIGYHWGDIYVVSEPVYGQSFNTGMSEDADIVVENSNVYIVWEESTDTLGAGTDDDIFYRYFDGSSWSQIEVISEPEVGMNFNTAPSYDPEIEVWNGNVYITWEDTNETDGSSTDYDIFFRAYNPGSGWGEIQVISEPVPGDDRNTAGSYDPSIAVDNGKVYVAWDDSNNTDSSGTDSDIFVRYNLTGTSWEPVQVASEPTFGTNTNTGSSYDCSIAADNGIICVVWEDGSNIDGAGTDEDVFIRTNKSSVWGPLQVISEPVEGFNINTGSCDDPVVAIDNSNIYAAWDDSNNTYGSGTDDDIFYRCNLSGGGWDPVQVISEPVFGANTNTAASSMAEIAVENGDVHIVWYDQWSTQGSGLDYDIFYMCNLTGTNWEPFVIISEPEAGYNFNTAQSYYPTIGIENGKTHIVWDDGNNTNNAGTDYDIFYRCTYFAPELSNGGVTPTSGNVTTCFNFTVTYTDRDNDPPTSMKVLVNGSGYNMQATNPLDTNYRNGKDYYLELRHLKIKTHNYKFSASDGYYISYLSFLDEPVVSNSPPEITTSNDPTAIEDVLYQVDYEYEDIDFTLAGQIGTWSLQTSTNWLTIDPATGVLSGIPTQADVGSCLVNVTINDTYEIDWTEFQINIQEVNDPPTIGPDELLIATEDEFYDVVLELDDEETSLGGLDWNIKTDASWLTVNKAQHRLNGTPSNDDVRDDYWVYISLNDGEKTAQRNYTLVVVNVNDAPVITTEDRNTATAGEYYAVHYEAIDVDPTNDTLIWSLKTDAGTWLQVDKTTGWLHGTPLEHNIGEHWVEVSVTDGLESDHHYFILSIEAVFVPNQNPVIITEDVLAATAGELYYVNYEATDDRTPVRDLVWALETDASWLSFNTKYGSLSGTPGDSEVGPWAVNISVYDDDGGVDRHNFIINVTKPYSPPLPPPSNNTRPELNSGKMEPMNGDKDTEFTFSVHYSDEDGDPPSSITVVIDNVEHKMTLVSGDASNGDYKYETKLSKGYHTYYFKANDGEDDAEPSDETPTGAVGAEVTPGIEGDEEDEKSAGLGDMLLWLVLIIVIIILIAVLFFAMNRRKPAPRPPERPAPPEAEEEEDEWEEE